MLGARERTRRLVRRRRARGHAALHAALRRARGGEQTQLFVKEVKVEAARYIVCRNEAEAEKDAARPRRRSSPALDQQLKRGDKALIGNSAYRRYLRSHRDGSRPRLRDRPRQAGRRGALRRHLRAAHQRPSHAAAGGAALPRSDPGRGAVPHRQGADAHAADLSLLGRRHPRPRVLLVPRPGAAQGTGRALPQARLRRPNGATCCATSIGCRRSRSARTARRITLRTAATGVGRPAVQGRCASPCRPICTSAPPDLTHPSAPGCSANTENRCRNLLRLLHLFCGTVEVGYEEDQTPYRAEAESLRRFPESEIFPGMKSSPRTRKPAAHPRTGVWRSCRSSPARTPCPLEVHLDRKLERMLVMLFKLQELRRARTRLNPFRKIGLAFDHFAAAQERAVVSTLQPSGGWPSLGD